MSNHINVNEVAANFLSNQVEGLFEYIKTLGKTIGDRAKLALKASVKSYVESSYTTNSFARSFFYKHEPAYLYSFYIPVGVECGDVVIPKANARELFARSPRVVIQGSGGCGKTILMRHLLLDILRLGERIPVMVELRSLNQAEEPILTLIIKSLKWSKLDISEELFEWALSRGMFALLFDGFDELDTRERARVSKAIQSLAQKSKDTWIIVTSRPNDEFRGWNQFHIYEIMPLSLEQAVGLSELSPVDQELKRKFIARLESDLFDQHRSFLSNPLLLSIMLVTYHDTAEIPTKLSVFYAQAYEALFQRHDAWKGGFSRKKESGLDTHDFAKLFSGFSILAYDQRLFTFSKSVAIGITKSASNLTSISISPDSFLRDATEAICLLVEDGLNLGYAHRSFQEFFAAKFIADAPPEIKTQLATRVSVNARHDNVIPLLHEIQPIFVETSILLPALKQFVADLGLKNKKISRSMHLKYLKMRFDHFNIRDGECYATHTGKKRINDDLASLALKLAGSRVDYGVYTSHKSWTEFRIKHFGDDYKEISIKKLTIQSPLIKHLYDDGHYFGAKFLLKIVELIEVFEIEKQKADTSLISFFAKQ